MVYERDLGYLNVLAGGCLGFLFFGLPKSPKASRQIRYAMCCCHNSHLQLLSKKLRNSENEWNGLLNRRYLPGPTL